MKLEKFKMDMLLMGWSYTPLNANLVKPNKKSVTSHIWIKNNNKIIKSYLTDSLTYHTESTNIVGRTFGSFESVLHHLMVNGEDAAEVEEYHYENTLRLDIKNERSQIYSGGKWVDII